ncbi:helix-turn-helix domain-containing protein [Roseicyclus mahoneyensis]|uniref:Cytoskeletal protein RodZ n=1 Tax=Roseicyclus mahoneyensis TaxID=164332 RepID=A0A316GPU3_9RHOB|nr:RodZ domain-containing protein [Roseicyclus mahoneyensis]PWK62648.1 cytoskeletal protein RodZ [Roseicyclus mahoneyensis]
MAHDHGQSKGQETAAAVAARSAIGGFDGYDVTDVALGDLMRGERATLGKSLLDVERELKIRAAYIAAIENGDVGAFSSPGFIAGYVRSYARYLAMDPEWTFRRFCEETGFYGVHGPSAQQARDAKRMISDAPPRKLDPNEVIKGARISFAPKRDSLLSGVEPGALGSFAVLIAVVMGLGYGAWAILHDIQRLQIAPVDQAPLPLAQLDPLAGATDGAFAAPQGFDIAMPGPDTLGRLYRPEALEAPVLTPRDGALATLDPDEVGTLGGLDRASSREAPRLVAAAGGVEADEPAAASPVQVTAARREELVVFAVRPSWVRVTSASGATLFEGTLNRGDSYTVPIAEQAPRLRSGNAGSVYFAVNGVTMGPAGPGATIARDVELSADAISANFAMADAQADPDLPDVAALVLSVDGTQ